MAVGSDLAGCGGVFRSSLGSWEVGFCKKLGCCNAQVAEEWAIYEALQISWDLNFRRIVLEFDAVVVVELILNSSFNFW